MSCYRPLPFVQGADPDTGEFRTIYAKLGAASLLEPRLIELPCGKCIGCRKSRAQSWAVRCLHEARMHAENCFLTLTYRDDPVSLVPRDLWLFHKRLRSRIGKLRYFAVGEYGGRKRRPHYHSLVFGYGFPDRKLHSGSGKTALYTSDVLSELWSLGHAVIGSVTAESAQYVANYSVKGKLKDPISRRAVAGVREFCVMSRNPGIGAGWIDAYQGTVFPRDFIVLPGGRRVGVPRYYLDRQRDAGLVERVKEERRKRNVVEDFVHELERRPARELYDTLVFKHFEERRLANEIGAVRRSG